MKNLMTLVAGQGDMGGGEQMLLRIGEAARSLSWEVRVVGPRWGDLHAACANRGLEYRACQGVSRRAYCVSAFAHLRRRDLGLVWANGALPSLAATATPNSLVVHLHQRPSVAHTKAIWAAQSRALAVLVPSESMQAAVPGSLVMLNWTEDLAPLARRPEPGTFTVAYLGRLSLDKGVDTLASAVDLLARESGDVGVRLLIGGDSRFVPPAAARPVRDALRSCSAQVVELGWVEPRQVLAQADVVVVPSRWPEPFGLVAAEAMAMGCPLIVSDSGALPEVVGAGYPWVFPAGDVDTLAGLLARMRVDGPSDIWALRRRWRDNFGPTAGRGRLQELLQSLDC